MKRWISLLGCVWLLGCASVGPGPRPAESVFNDSLFVAPEQRPDANTLFALTPQMKRYIAERIEPLVRRKGAQMALIDALYTQGELRLEYDAQHTRSAAEAFDARMGNCLSLVIMTAAFANELGLQVRFQDVLGAPAVEQSGELTFVVGHVNLALSGGLRDARPGVAEQSWLLVDFLPGQDLYRQRTLAVDERRIRAMFMNNRAAEELARGRVNDAYWWLRGAWAQDPGFANLYNTLGVVYRHRGALAEAEQALLAAQKMDPANEHVAGNLSGVQLALGRPVDAKRVAGGQGAAPGPLSAAALRFDSARLALEQGRLKQALLLLHGELTLTPRNPELHHWLAVTHARMGDTTRARRHLELAADYSGTGEQHALYISKLERLKAQLLQTQQ